MQVSKPQSPISRFQASAYLEQLYRKLLADNNLQDTQDPDWYSALVENARDPDSPSGIESGCERGNRKTYTQLQIIRVGKKPFYSPADLHDWFRIHIEHVILNRAQRLH